MLAACLWSTAKAVVVVKGLVSLLGQPRKTSRFDALRIAKDEEGWSNQ